MCLCVCVRFPPAGHFHFFFNDKIWRLSCQTSFRPAALHLCHFTARVDPVSAQQFSMFHQERTLLSLRCSLVLPGFRESTVYSNVQEHNYFI